VKQDQAQIDNARTQLSYTTVTSPLDGRTGIRQVDAGNIVHAADPMGLVVITQLQPISVLFTLPQQTLPQVSRALSQGPAATLAFNQGATGDRGGLLDTGTLAVLDNQVDPTTGTIKLKATFPNPDHRLWPGAFVGVRVQVDTAIGAVVVPPAAVQRGPRNAYVYVVNADGTATRRGVSVGHEDAQASIISEGVKPGERVVVDGASRLTDGSRVTVVQPAPPSGSPATDQPAPPGTRRRQAGAPA
jgi:multidrug efflux system membrane fusion protein